MLHWYVIGFLVALSVILLLLRWLYPPAWEAWLRVAKPWGEFMARSLMRVFYLVLTGPFGLVLRRQRPQIHQRHPGTSYWEESRPRAHTLDEIQQQF